MLSEWKKDGWCSSVYWLLLYWYLIGQRAVTKVSTIHFFDLLSGMASSYFRFRWQNNWDVTWNKKLAVEWRTCAYNTKIYNHVFISNSFLDQTTTTMQCRILLKKCHGQCLKFRGPIEAGDGWQVLTFSSTCSWPNGALYCHMHMAPSFIFLAYVAHSLYMYCLSIAHPACYKVVGKYWPFMYIFICCIYLRMGLFQILDTQL